MKKIKEIGLCISTLILVLGPAISLAQIGQSTVGVANTPQPRGLGEWLGVIKGIFQWMYTIILVISVGLGLYAAFLYLTSGGDKDKVKQASKYLIYAIIGLIVAVLAFSITKIVGSLIGQESAMEVR